MPPLRARFLGIGILAVLAVWACDGGNLFGPGAAAGPRIIELTAPDRVDAGAELPVSVRAAAAVRIDSIVIGAVVGESEQGEALVPQSRSLDVRVETVLEVPAVITDTALTLTVRAVDAQGNLSPPLSHVVRAVDLTPPDVRVALSQDEVALGKDLNIEVGAEDNVGLARLGFRFVGAEGDTVVRVEESAQGREATRTFTFTVPRDLGLGEFVVEGVAEDVDGNVGTEAAQQPLRVVFVDEEAPSVEILSPSEGASFEARQEVPLHVRVRDDDAVSRVTIEGLALRGDPDLGTDETVVKFEPWTIEITPPTADTTLTRILIPTDEVTPEEVVLIVTAEDEQGNVGADTVAIQLTPEELPRVQFIQPEEGAGVPLGDSIFVEAAVAAPFGIGTVTFDGVAHRGDPAAGTDEVVQRFAPRTITLGGAVNDTVLMRWLQAAGEQTTEVVYIRAVVEDGVGNAVADSVEVIVGGPSVQVPDLESGQTVSGGQEIQIRVLASDPQGLEVVEVELTGVAEETLQQVVSGTSAEVVFGFTVPEGVTGSLNIRARARNQLGIHGQAPLVELNVVDEAAVDTTPPEVRVVIEPQGSSGDPNRIEATDAVRVSVVARDNTGGTGVKKAGYTVRIVRRQAPGDTLWITDEIETASGVGSTVTRVFDPTMLEDFVDSSGDPFFDPVNRPDTLDLDFFGWAEDAATDGNANPAPNCAAAVSADTFQQLECETVAVSGDDFVVAEDETGQRVTLAVVSGETVRLPDGGSIADAVVDPDEERGLLFLSNIQLSRLEVFDLQERTFGPPILIGSEPWGMAFGMQEPDLLYVGNSGGTNISVVDVNAQEELLEERVLTPNTLLFDVAESSSDGGITIEVTVHDFSDRPQFVAQDADGRLVYSTRPTGVAPDGTIRVADFFGGETEVYLFTEHGTTEPADGTYALSNVDGYEVRSFSGGSGVVTRRRRPYEAGTILSDTLAVALGVTPNSVTNLRDSVQAHLDAIGYGEGGGGAGAADFPDVFLPSAGGGRWNVESVGLSDTTFISASGDGTVIAIGEGATAEAGRIFLWKADFTNPQISSFTSVIDLVGNAAERVLGVDMNFDGTMGVSRGIFEAYFFDDELRLQGTAPVEEGGAGVALHPLHTEGPVGTRRDVALAFVPVGGGRINVYSTINFNRIGRIHVRDDIVGPLRASLPYTADNDGLACEKAGIAGTGQEAVEIFSGSAPNSDGVTNAECTVVKLSGISTDGGVVVINVTKADIFRELD